MQFAAFLKLGNLLQLYIFESYTNNYDIYVTILKSSF